MVYPSYGLKYIFYNFILNETTKLKNPKIKKEILEGFFKRIKKNSKTLNFTLSLHFYFFFYNI